MTRESALMESTEKNGLADFAALMGDVAGLSEEQREKVVYFAQGVIAASDRRKADDSNE
jgi:hypothetical protein